MIPNLIVPVLNRYDLLQRLLNSLDHPIKHLLIIDNGAAYVEQDQELNIPECVERTTYLPMPSNLGVAASWNLGIKLFPMDTHWTFASNDMFFEPGELQKLATAEHDELTLMSDFPYFHAFAIGEEVVQRVGLMDEAFTPAYFEDTDFVRRCEYHNVAITYLDVKTQHDNSSTIKSDSSYRFRNTATFQRNQRWFDRKQREGDYSQGGWDLGMRRENDWSK
jgi:GT2 family glycosyltransferase